MSPLHSIAAAEVDLRVVVVHPAAPNHSPDAHLADQPSQVSEDSAARNAGSRPVAGMFDLTVREPGSTSVMAAWGTAFLIMDTGTVLATPTIRAKPAHTISTGI
jgi:hypothetical protein